MYENLDFVIKTEAMKAAEAALVSVYKTFRNAVENIETSSEKLFNRENWRGEARDEFYDTYTIIRHNLKADEQQMSSLSEIILGIKDVYEATDLDTAKQLISSIGDVRDVFSDDGEKVPSK